MFSNRVHDEEAFRRLFDVAYRPLLAYALRRGASRVDAEEVVSETLLVAWRRRDELPEDGALPWLYGVARRVLANQRRSAGRRRSVAALLGSWERAHGDPADQAQLAEDTRAVLAACGSLSTADQEVLRLAAWEGLSHREISVSLGCSENAAALRLHRARLRLRDALLKEAGLRGHKAIEVKR